MTALGIVACGSTASWIVTAGVCLVLGIPAARAMPGLATAALVSFYWFTGVRVVAAWGAGPDVAWAVRGTALVVWLVWAGLRFAPRWRRTPDRAIARSAEWPALSGPRTGEPRPSTT